MAARTRKLRLDDKHKDDIAATQLLKILKTHAVSKSGKLSSSRIAAARVALPFLIPTLSSVDSTLHTPDDELSEDQLIEKFQGLIAARPDLLQRLLALQAKAQPGISEAAATQQTGDNAQEIGNNEAKVA